MNRITYNMSLIRNQIDQRRNLLAMSKIQTDISSGVTIRRPSDDPLRASRYMRLKTEMLVNELYKSNLDAAESWTKKTDNSLRNVNAIIERMKNLLTQAANGTNENNTDLNAIATELKQLKEAAITAANDDYMGRHQFSGHRTDLKFVNEDGTYNKVLDLAGLDYETMDYIIGVSQNTRINCSGVKAFGHEYYHTHTRSGKDVPFFEDKPKTLLGGTVNITIQKYHELYDDVPREQRPEEYENDQYLEKTLGKPITFENVTFYANYDKGDINTIVEDMNKSLRDKMHLYVENQTYTGTPQEIQKKKDQLYTELKNAAQFVNDNGRIAFVTDNNYGLDSITDSKSKLNIIKGTPANVKGIPNPAGKIPLTDPVNYNDPDKKVDAAFAFDIFFDTYKKDENGDLVNPPVIDQKHGAAGTPDDPAINIAFAKTYEKNGLTDKQLALNIAFDLQQQINEQINEYNKTAKNKIEAGSIRVVVDPVTNQVTLTTDKNSGLQVKNDPNNYQQKDSKVSGTASKAVAADPTSPGPGELGENPAVNKPGYVDIFDLSSATIDHTKDFFAGVGVNIDLSTYPAFGKEQGRILYVGHKTITPPPPGTKPFGYLDTTKPQQVVPPIEISLRNEYSGDKSNILMNLRDDIQKQINEQIDKINEARIYQNEHKGNPDDPDMVLLSHDDVVAVVEGQKIKLQISKDMTYNVKDGTIPSDLNKFDEAALTPTNETKMPIDLTMDINTDPNGDTNFYMDLNFKITEYERDEYGNIKKDGGGNPILKEPPIILDEVSLQKKYSRLKQPYDSTKTLAENMYTDDQIKEQIFNDVKKIIDDKIASINPPIPKNSVIVRKDGDKIVLDVSPEIRMEVTADAVEDKKSGNPQILEKPDYLPKSEVDKNTGKPIQKQPFREVMPFFEMVDRIVYMCEHKDHHGLSRMEAKLDWHDKNNLKVQGEGGGRLQMYEIMQVRTAELKINFQNLLSETKDTDYAEASGKLSTYWQIYKASLAMTARILTPSLVDFIR